MVYNTDSTASNDNTKTPQKTIFFFIQTTFEKQEIRKRQLEGKRRAILLYHNP
jgi:hypothetical protein